MLCTVINDISLERKILVSNFIYPLYELPQVHERNKSMRPIIPFLLLPTNNLAKYLNDYWYKTVTELQASSIENYQDLMKKEIQYEPSPDNNLYWFRSMW